MPTLLLRVAPLLNPERHGPLARALTALTAQRLNKRAEVTAVLIQDLPAAQWHIGGETVEQPTALLEISITAGTNTASEKAAFIREAWLLLDEHIGHAQGLHPASYVVVRELPAGDWGYGGQTQAARALQRGKVTTQA